LFGVRPWEWDLMPAAEIYQLVRYLDEREKSADG
jgi:hypothetical protein